jgi:isopenicillin N synthase-like dioxygenase
MQSDKHSIPVIDISPLLSSPVSPSSPEALQVARNIYDACRTWGFFQITGHGVSLDVQKQLLQCAKEFFAQPEEQKLALHVKKGGVAWRGDMPLGGEGTHGRVDHKEGMYFGPEHPKDHRHAGLPLHGQNQFPDAVIPVMRSIVLQYIDQVTELGKTISDAISLSFCLDGHFIRDNYLQSRSLCVAVSGTLQILPHVERKRLTGKCGGSGNTRVG